MVYIKINYSVTDVYISGNGDAPVYIKVGSGDGGGSGTVTSVDMTVPTGFVVSGNPITSDGTLAVSYATGYSLPTSAKQAEWDQAYNDKINSASVTGTSTKTLTLNQQDGGTITASWSDADTGLTSVGLTMPSAFSVANSPLTSNGTIAVTGAGTTAQYVRGDGSLATFPSVASEAKTLIREVYNKTGATLTKGTVVYIDGGQGNLPTITKALASGDTTSAQTFGIVQSDITNMNNGFVVVAGGIDNLDTQAYAAGTALYLSPTTAGAWTSTKPYAPNHLVYLGVVVRSHPTQGVIEVKIQNGYELDELHNVAAQTPSNNDGIFYNTTTQLWENKSIPTALGYTPVTDARTLSINGTSFDLSANRSWSVGTVTSITASAPLTGGTITGSGTIGITQASGTTNGFLSSTDWTTFNNKQNALTNPITGSAASGQVAYFTGATTQAGSNNLFWDATNNRLGIGTNAPSVDFEVVKSVGSGGGVAGRIVNTNSAGIAGLVVRNDQSEYGALELFGSTYSAPSLQRQATFTSSALNGFSFILYNSASTANFSIKTGNPTIVERFRLFNNTGNVLIQNGGTFTDGGQRLQVTGDVNFGGASGFTWDNANGRLGIGTNAPTKYFELKLPTGVNTLNNGFALSRGSGTGTFVLGNATSNINDFVPSIYSKSSVDNAGFYFAASVFGASSTFPAMEFQAANSTNTGAIGNSQVAVRFTNWTTQIADFRGNGNLLIGTTTDGGQRLQVQGTTLLNGTVAVQDTMTFANNKGFVLNAGGTNRQSGILPVNLLDNFSGIQLYPSAGTNVASTFNVVPKGTGLQASLKSQINVFNTDFVADSTNYELAVFRAGGTNYSLSTGKAGTGTTRPLLLSAGFATDAVTNGNQLWLFTSGNVGIGTGTDSATQLSIGGSITASSAIARGTLINTTLTASANNDVLVGLDVNPTFTNGAFTGVTNLAARFQNNVQATRSVNGQIAIEAINTNTGTIASSAFNARNSTSSISLGKQSTGYTPYQIIAANDGVIYNSGGNISIYNDTSGGIIKMAAGAAATTQLAIFSNGNVGINQNTDAGFRLDVSGTCRVQGALTGSGVISAATNFRLNNQAFSQVAILDAGGSFAGGYNLTLSGTTPQHNSTGAISGYYYGSGGTIRFYADSSQTAGTNATERMRLDASGRLGIGTTNPSCVLHTYTSAQNAGLFQSTQSEVNIRFDNSGATSNIFGATGANFYWYSGGAERMRLTSAGRLLLGTTTESTFLLDVNGTARVQDNLTVSKNQNANTIFTVSNTTSGTNAEAQAAFISNNGTGVVTKYSSTHTAYKTALANDFIIYNNTTAGDISILNDFATGKIKFAAGGSSTVQWEISSSGDLTAGDGENIIVGSTNGTKIGTATSQKIGFWNATPIVQPTTAVAAATRVGGGGTTVTDTDTFDGYTIAQIVKALRNAGLLA